LVGRLGVDRGKAKDRRTAAPTMRENHGRLDEATSAWLQKARARNQASYGYYD